MGWEKPVRGDETKQIYVCYVYYYVRPDFDLELRIFILWEWIHESEAPASSVTTTVTISDSWTIFGKSEHHLAPTDLCKQL